MVSHSHNCIYVHIPKVAGTSVSRMLRDANTSGKRIRSCRDMAALDDNFSPPPPHLRAWDHVRFGHVSEEEFAEYFKFTFVRNPWDRLVSEYHYRGHSARIDFKTFLFKRFPRPAWSDAYCHVIPQYEFIHDEAGDCLVDYIGRFENLHEDFNEICRRLQLPEMELIHKNKSSSMFGRRGGKRAIFRNLRDQLSRQRKKNTFSHYSEYYDTESREAVSELYRKDIETFGYTFEEA